MAVVLDDTTIEKPYAKKMELVTYHWSGKHKRVVKGIALLSMLWSDRVYDKPSGGKSKNEHFREMLLKAKEKGFSPEYVLMDIASFGWFFLTRLKSNRLVNPDGRGNVPISSVEIPEEGIPDCLQRRGRGLPSRDKAMLWGGEGAGEEMRVFLRLEVYRLRTGVSWYEAKAAIVFMSSIQLRKS